MVEVNWSATGCWLWRLELVGPLAGDHRSQPHDLLRQRRAEAIQEKPLASKRGQPRAVESPLPFAKSATERNEANDGWRKHLACRVCQSVTGVFLLVAEQRFLSRSVVYALASTFV